MSSFIFEKNIPKWTNQQILNELDNFIPLYEKRPIKNNKGGMLFSHMFFFYFILRNLEPELIIESGVFKGQSTWLIENVLPNSEIISLDINLSQREYISKKSNYFSKDFRFMNFSKIPKNTLVFFDDHVNHVDRLIEANFFGIKNIVFEDNYPSGKGDFQTIKQIYNNFYFNHKPSLLSIIKTNILFNKIFFKKIFIKKYNAQIDLQNISQRIRDGYSDKEIFENIEKIINCYFEFPPLIKYDFHKDNKIIKDPLLEKIPENLSLYLDEINIFNFLTYIKLN